ncbi:MAG: hypothetical protein R3D31_05090 [Hyphomicrobiaceae bacterium]
MSRFALTLALAAGLLAMLAIAPASAQTIDPHRVWELKCAGCHGKHSRDFAKENVRKDGGKVLATKSGKPLDRLLERHRGTRLSDGEIDALVKHFGAMLKTGWLYERKCIVCHERAVDLARLHLIEREGRLEGRYTGRDIASFLTDHGRLAPAEIATVLAMLRRQLRTEEH